MLSDAGSQYGSLAYSLCMNEITYCGKTNMKHGTGRSKEPLLGPLCRFWRHVSDFKNGAPKNLSPDNRKIKLFRANFDLAALTVVRMVIASAHVADTVGMLGIRCFDFSANTQ